MPTEPTKRYREVSGRRPLAALALGAFAIGTAELVVVGILNLVAAGQHVSVSSSGQMVTAYALGIALGAPLLTALTARMDRRFLLCLALAVFAAGNALAAAATNFDLLLVARVVTGSVHGLFIGVASVIAAGLVAPERRGHAISMVFGGIAVSTVVGVPLGTLVGEAIGWRAAFVVVVALTAAALLASLAFVPSVPTPGSARLKTQSKAALAPRVLAVLGVGLLLMGAQFTAFTYLAAFLQRVAGLSGGAISGFLLIFGLAAAAGTLLGGKGADRNADRSLFIANLGVVLALGFVFVVRASPAAVAVGLAAWGLATFAMIPSFQLRVITLGGRGADLAATLGASAINAGIALGSLLGGAVLAHHGPSAPVVVAVVLSALAAPATWATRFLHPPPSFQAGEDASSPAAQSAREDDDGNPMLAGPNLRPGTEGGG